MSPVAIILGVVMIILIYVLYKYFTTSTSTLGAEINLAVAQVTPFTAKANIANSTSLRYAYGVWIYVDSWDSLATKDIFYRKNVDNYDIRLYLEKLTPTLKCDFYTGSTETVTITNNFPIQKWVYIIVSVDNRVVDCYIDGKLTTSQQLQKQPIVSDSDINVGKFSARLAKFQRFTSPIDPAAAWSNYMSGNGSTLKNMFSSYGVDVSFKKDNVEQQKFTII